MMIKPDARAHRVAIARLSLLLGIAVLAAPALAQTVDVPSATTAGGTEWRWVQSASNLRSIEVDLVKASVEILQAKGSSVELIAQAAGLQPGGEPVRLVLASDNGRYRIEDRFPMRPRSILNNECLPPTGFRGDFWRHARPLTVRVFAPRGLQLSVWTMSGTVTDRR